MQCSLLAHLPALSAGRIFEFVHTPAVVNQETLPQIVGVLLGSIRDMPHIAEKVCYAMAQLAAGFKDDDSTSLFSPYFKEIVGALLDAVLPGPHALALFMWCFLFFRGAVCSWEGTQTRPAALSYESHRSWQGQMRCC